MRDVIDAWRHLARHKLLTCVIVLSLGIGIGVNTVVFSWIQALTLRPLPGVSEASRFHLIEPVSDAAVRPGASWREYRDLETAVRSFDALIAFRMVPLNVGVAARTERASALLVSGNYFPVLHVQPALGRFLLPAEAAVPGREAVVVISYDYWQSRLGGTADVLGRRLRVNDVELAIVGVAPARFQGTVLGLQFDLWVPASMAPVVLRGSRELEDRAIRGYYVMGALRPGVTIGDAQAETTAAMRRLAEQFPESNRSMGADVLPFWRAGRGPQGFLLQGLAGLQGVMLVLLLAVCGNTVNLVLARASTKAHDVAVRLALGASRWRIIRLQLAESLWVGVAAAAVGTVLAFWGTNALRAVPVLTTQFPVRFQTDLDLQTLAFALTLGLVAALLSGVVPAVQLARLSPLSTVRVGTGITGSRMGQVLMAVEVALAAMVLVIAALFWRNFQQTQQIDPGFRPQGVLLASYDLSNRGTSPDEWRLFAERALTRLRALPDVTAAALAVSVPLDIHGLPSRPFALEGRPAAADPPDRALSNTVTPGYFATMGIALLEGDDFVGLSDRSAPAQAIVNQAFVQRFVGEGETLGRGLTIGNTTYRIAGVVRTSLNESFNEPPTPVIYLSYRDRPSTFAEMHVRTPLGDELMLAPALRAAIGDLDPALPLFNVRTLSQHVEMNLALRRIPAQMFMGLGPLILVLAAVGVYAVVAYNMSRRTTEIGIRMALGAGAQTVVRQVMAEHLRVVAAGAVVGWAVVAYGYTRFMRGTLDWTAFAATPLLLVVVAALACWLPARRASRIDPLAALRTD